MRLNKRTLGPIEDGADIPKTNYERLCVCLRGALWMVEFCSIDLIVIFHYNFVTRSRLVICFGASIFRFPGTASMNCVEHCCYSGYTNTHLHTYTHCIIYLHILGHTQTCLHTHAHTYILSLSFIII